MTGILIQLAASWLLLWLFEKKSLNSLGLKPAANRLLGFVFGFIASATIYTVYCLATTFLTSNTWAINENYSLKNFISSTGWTLSSVIFEELIFRGALLYILIQKSGERTACFVSAAAFGVYHWFSFGVIGNPVQMTYVFVLTGIWGLMFAFSFSITKSLYLPAGLHFGWNLFNIVIFSQGPLGDQFLISRSNGQLLTGLSSIGLQLFQIAGLPSIVYVYLRKCRKLNRQESKE